MKKMIWLAILALAISDACVAAQLPRASPARPLLAYKFRTDETQILSSSKAFTRKQEAKAACRKSVEELRKHSSEFMGLRCVMESLPKESEDMALCQDSSARGERDLDSCYTWHFSILGFK